MFLYRITNYTQIALRFYNEKLNQGLVSENVTKTAIDRIDYIVEVVPNNPSPKVLDQVEDIFKNRNDTDLYPRFVDQVAVIDQIDE